MGLCGREAPPRVGGGGGSVVFVIGAGNGPGVAWRERGRSSARHGTRRGRAGGLRTARGMVGVEVEYPGDPQAPAHLPLAGSPDSLAPRTARRYHSYPIGDWDSVPPGPSHVAGVRSGRV